MIRSFTHNRIGRLIVFAYCLCLTFIFSLSSASGAEPNEKSAREKALTETEGREKDLSRIPIGAAVRSALDGERLLTVELIARFQHYNPGAKNPADHYDRHIYSPKSVRYSKRTEKVYVNSLEGTATVVYDPSGFHKIGVIFHRFGKGRKNLFFDKTDNMSWATFPEESDISSPNLFEGKPVEFAETHGGKYIWVSYYRRSYDPNAALPSAVAVIDTEQDKIVRVISTGPLPKSLAASPDGKSLAVIHWGDNTVGFIDVGSDDPKDFRHSGLVTVENRYAVKKSESKINRDKACGYCLRGGVFTPDSRYLIVGRMKGGGLAVIDVAAQKYIGTLYGMKPTPRHLVLSPDGKILYLSSNASGFVSSYETGEVIRAVLDGRKSLAPVKEVATGVGTRTIDLTPDGKWLFAAVKYASRVAVIDTLDMSLVTSVPTDSYPVGLDVSPDGGQLWVTAQGVRGRGGNSVSVYKLSTGTQKVDGP